MNLIVETLAVWFEEQYQENGWVPELPDACDLLVRAAIGAWLGAVMPLEPWVLFRMLAAVHHDTLAGPITADRSLPLGPTPLLRALHKLDICFTNC